MVNAFTHSGLFGDMFRDPEISAHFGAEPFLQNMLRFEITYTKGLGELGCVAPDLADQALAALRDTRPDLARIARGSDRDGLPAPEWVNALKAAAGPAAKALHSGATSQDVLDTAMVLTLRKICALLEQRLQDLLAALDGLATRFGARQMMGHTRMQAALPIPVAHRIQAWRAPLQNCAKALPGLRDGMGLQFGGPVGLRDRPEGQGAAMAAILARELDLPDPGVWHSDRAAFVDLGHGLMRLTGALGKLGQDIALMAQLGDSGLRLSGAGGSSAMPHKQNPIRAEALVTLARYVTTQQAGLGQALVHEQERSGAAWALEWMILPALAEATGAALRHGTALIGSIEEIGREN